MIFKKNIILPKYSENGIFIRQNRSFVIRRKKMSNLQINIIKENWLNFHFEFQTKQLGMYQIFNNNYPVIIDIGFGNGKSLVKMAKRTYDINFLGIEVYLKGISNCLKYANICVVKNLKIIYHDAVEVIKYMIPNNSIYKIHIFFPDPWSKKKHHKRRILTKKFITLLSNKIICGGILHIKTDCKLYFYKIINIVKDIKCLYRIQPANYFKNAFNINFVTKFEQRAISLGYSINNLILLKADHQLSKNF